MGDKRPPIAMFLAIVAAVGFALALGKVTGAVFDDPGPFYRTAVQARRMGPDGAEFADPAEVVTLGGDTLFVIRAHDAATPPQLRAALLVRTLNHLVADTDVAGRPPRVLARPCPGETGAFGVYWARPTPPGDTLLIRLTYEDARMERFHGDTDATILSVGEAWRRALEVALEKVAGSSAARSPRVRPAPSPPDDAERRG